MTGSRDLSELSYEFLAAVRRGENTEEFRETLATLSDSQLRTLGEDTDAATAFWVNVYNAFVQLHLDWDPSLYENRRRFFGEERITIAETQLSLDDIEHGLLRSSKWKYGLGYVPRPFPSAFERAHRLPEVDPRIHFALNCGAESCPPIVAYTASDIDQELETSTQSFLRQSSAYDSETDAVRVTRLFLYYRGDFGGRDGIYRFLETHGVIEAGHRPSVRYEPYDWTIHTGHYRETKD